jgi:hypothetical protein
VAPLGHEHHALARAQNPIPCVAAQRLAERQRERAHDIGQIGGARWAEVDVRPRALQHAN